MGTHWGVVARPWGHRRRLTGGAEGGGHPRDARAAVQRGNGWRRRRHVGLPALRLAPSRAPHSWVCYGWLIDQIFIAFQG